MEMPEGWKRLRLKEDERNFDCPCPLCFSLDLMCEMAEALEDQLGKREHYLRNSDILKKFKEWK